MNLNVLNFIIDIVALILGGGFIILGYYISRKNFAVGLFIIVLAFSLGVFTMKYFTPEVLGEIIG